jgi:hypothetical protein
MSPATSTKLSAPRFLRPSILTPIDSDGTEVYRALNTKLLRYVPNKVEI